MNLEQAREALWEHPARAIIFEVLDEVFGEHWQLFANKVLALDRRLEVKQYLLDQATHLAFSRSRHLFLPYLPDYSADFAAVEDLRELLIAAIEKESRAVFVHSDNDTLYFESRLMHRNGWRREANV